MRELRHFSRSAITKGILLALASSTHPLFAQDNIEEVIVTAQKREQAVLDVPQAISVVSSEEIENMGAGSLADIQSTIPSLVIFESPYGNNDTITLRNIGSDVGTDGLPTVGRYVDEANVNNDQAGSGISFPLLDLERVEILKGPQGTLYGESAIGGAVKYLTRNPSLLGEYDLQMETNSNSVDSGGNGYRLSAAGNVISTEHFGLRLAAMKETTPGWVDSEFFGKESNEQQRESYRLKALWAPTDNFSADLMHQHYEAEQGAYAYSDLNFFNDGFAPAELYEEWDLTNFTINWDITPNISLVSATSKQERVNNTPGDQSGFLPFFEIFGPGTTVLAPEFGNEFSVANPVEKVGTKWDSTIDNISHETRLNGQVGDRLFWTAGYYWKDTSFAVDFISVNYPDNSAGVVGLLTIFDRTTEANAVFGEVAYQFNDQWEVTAGLRRYEDTRSIDSLGSRFGAPEIFYDADVENSTTIGRLVLKYTLDRNTTLYASASEGFRSGGTNSSDTERDTNGRIPNTFGPEELITYEFGVKGRTLGGDLRYEFATYLSDYEDIQVTEPIVGLSGVVNGGQAEIKGFETALSYDITQDFFVNLSYSYNDAQFTENDTGHVKGDPFNGVPLYSTLGVSADYKFNLWGSSRGHLRIDWFEQDEQESNTTTPGFAITSQVHEGPKQLNARIGWLPNDNMSVYLYAENLTNEEQQLRKPFGGTLNYLLQQPRSIGVTARFRL